MNQLVLLLINFITLHLLLYNTHTHTHTLTHSLTVPAYIEMHSRQASDYLQPVSSPGRVQMDIYSEWREVLNGLLLAEDQLMLTESLGEGTDVFHIINIILSI